MIKDPRLVRVMQAGASTLVILVLWQAASQFFPPYLFPPVPDIVKRVVDIFVSGPLVIEVLVTAARIFAGLLGAFVLGGLMALLIGSSPRIESYVTPVLVFLQGIPALSWVVIAIIWFHGIEFRIFFIMVMTTLPAFTSMRRTPKQSPRRRRTGEPKSNVSALRRMRRRRLSRRRK